MGEKAIEPYVRIEGLCKAFQSGSEKLEVLSGIDIQIPHGDMLAIVGASGVGKSTFLHVLGGLERPDRGRVLYGNLDVYGQDDKALARFRNERVGFVFQFHHLLQEFTAIENVMMPALVRGLGREAASGIARSLLADVGLSARGHHRPGELSGGEQQRVAVARALVLKPDVVLADEPTGNLDAHTGEAVHDLLVRINAERGITFVIVTHNDRMALRSKRVCRLIDGLLRRER